MTDTSVQASTTNTNVDTIIKLHAGDLVVPFKKSFLVSKSTYFEASLLRFNPDPEEKTILELNQFEYDEDIIRMLQDPDYLLDPYAKPAVDYYGIKDVKYRKQAPNTSFFPFIDEGKILQIKPDVMKREKVDKYGTIHQAYSREFYNRNATLIVPQRSSYSGFCLVGNPRDIAGLLENLSIEIRLYGCYNMKHDYIRANWIKQKMALCDISVERSVFPLDFILREVGNVDYAVTISFDCSNYNFKPLEKISVVFKTSGVDIVQSIEDYDQVLEKHLVVQPAKPDLKDQPQSLTFYLDDSALMKVKMIALAVTDTLYKETILPEEIIDVYVFSSNMGVLQFGDDMLQYDKIQAGIKNVDHPLHTITFGPIDSKRKWSRKWHISPPINVKLKKSDIARKVCLYILS
jgi:hypothetical protein